MEGWSAKNDISNLFIFSKLWSRLLPGILDRNYQEVTALTKTADISCPRTKELEAKPRQVGSKWFTLLLTSEAYYSIVNNMFGDYLTVALLSFLATSG